MTFTMGFHGGLINGTMMILHGGGGANWWRIPYNPNPYRKHL